MRERTRKFLHSFAESDQKRAAMCASRLINLYHSAARACVETSEGDVVELGCFRGDSALVLAMAIADAGRGARTLHLFDSFAGLPMPSPEDRLAEPERWQGFFSDTSPEAIVARFATWDLPPPRIVSGWVENTVPVSLPRAIAFAHLDLDLYAPMRHALEHVYPRLAAGGAMVLDDFGDPADPDGQEFPGVRQAALEHFGPHGIAPESLFTFAGAATRPGRHAIVRRGPVP